LFGFLGCRPKERQPRHGAGVTWADIIADEHRGPVVLILMHKEPHPQGFIVRTEGEETAPHGAGSRSGPVWAAWSVTSAAVKAVCWSVVRLVNSRPLS
jgi:hypothetical protein